MMIVFALGLTALLFCLLTTPVVRNLFLFLGKVDEPDSHRKFHTEAVPRSGGIGIFLSYFASLVLVYFLLPANTKVYINHHALVRSVLPATILMFLVGLADDLFDLRPRVKLAGQFVAVLVAVSLGTRITLLHGPAWLGFLLSIVWLLACTNAVNLIDGMDGLATGVGLTATLTTLTVALLSGNVGLAMATAPLAGALLAFLRYNFTPASVFLGDSGSLTIGFLLGCLGLVWNGHAGMIGMAGPLMTMALPLMDVSLSIGRRFLRGQPIFQGDRGHIHHRVLALGFSTREAALLLYGCCFLFASLALVQTFGQREMGIAIVLLFSVLVMLGVRRLGYVEFRAARRSIARHAIRNAVEEEIYLEELRHALMKVQTHEECWQVLRRICAELSLADARLQLGSESFVREAALNGNAASCQLRLHLADNTWLLLTGPTPLATRKLTNLTHDIQSAVHHRLSTLQASKITLNEAA